CTDKRVNQVTPPLFERFPEAKDFALASLEEIEEYIRSTGFYKNKARAIKEACQRIVDQFGGKVPNKMEDLLSLRGVARKTANVVMGTAFGKAEGVVVDTHVKRISRLLGLTEETSPEKIEKDLMALLPKKEWIPFSHMLIFHGREICKARNPQCEICELKKYCPSAKLNSSGS
ncbi:MAG: endonuclease III, partial [Planctomycetota bacterium]